MNTNSDEIFYIMMNDIRIFLSCAANQSFAKAAKEFQITPSMVSKRIAQLEEAIGCKLFIRDKNKVILNESGYEMKRRWKVLLQLYKDSVFKAREISCGVSNPIVFGLCSYANMDRYFIPLISSFESESFSFRVELYNSFDMVYDILNRRIDIFFAPYFMKEAVMSNKELDSYLVLQSSLYACIADDNPLCQKEVLLLEDLKDLDFIISNTDMNQEYSVWLSDLCSEKGFRMKKDLYTDSNSPCHFLVNESNVFVTDKYYQYFQSASQNYKEIKDTQSGLMIIWRKNDREIIKDFINHSINFCLNLKC